MNIDSIKNRQSPIRRLVCFYGDFPDKTLKDFGHKKGEKPGTFIVTFKDSKGERSNGSFISRKKMVIFILLGALIFLRNDVILAVGRGRSAYI